MRIGHTHKCFLGGDQARTHLRRLELALKEPWADVTGSPGPSVWGLYDTLDMATYHLTWSGELGCPFDWDMSISACELSRAVVLAGHTQRTQCLYKTPVSWTMWSFCKATDFKVSLSY